MIHSAGQLKQNQVRIRAANDLRGRTIRSPGEGRVLGSRTLSEEAIPHDRVIVTCISILPYQIRGDG